MEARQKHGHSKPLQILFRNGFNCIGKEKRRGGKKQILLLLLNTKSPHWGHLGQVNLEVEAKVLRYKYKVSTLNLTHKKCISSWAGFYRWLLQVGNLRFLTMPRMLPLQNLTGFVSKEFSQELTIFMLPHLWHFISSPST